MVCEPCAQCWRATERRMNLAKVVRDGEQGHGMTMICQLARPSGTKASKASVKRADAQIEPFNVRRANLVNIGCARNRFEFYAGAFWRAVTADCVIPIEFVVRLSINLLHHGEIKTAKQMISECRNVCAPAVTGDLNHAVHTLSQVCHEVVCAGVIPLASQVRDYQFCAPVNP